MQPVGKAIAGAIVKAQMAFGPALKTSQNPHFKSRYADLSACVEAVIEALNANGIALIQRTLPCESGVTVETVFLHTSGETLSSGPLHVPASKNDPQGYGSALTYARRYSLMAACGIAPEDDDGHAASKPQPRYANPEVFASDRAASKPAARTTDEAPKQSNGSRSAKAAVATNEPEPEAEDAESDDTEQGDFRGLGAQPFDEALPW
jgi:hypothetical protein